MEGNAGDLASKFLEVIPSYRFGLAEGGGHIGITGSRMWRHNAVTQDVIDGPNSFAEPTMANNDAPALALHLSVESSLQRSGAIWDYDFHRG